MGMQRVKCLQDSHCVCKCSKNDHNMKPLMTCTPNIKPLLKPPLRKLLLCQHFCPFNQNFITSLCACRSIHTLTAYAPAPVIFKTSVTNTQFNPILGLCISHPYFTIPWMIGMSVASARLPKVAARRGRKKG